MRSRGHRRRIRRLAFPQIFAEPGCSVILMDVQRAVVEALNLGESAVADVPSARLRLLVESGRLGATTDYDAANEADAAFIALPTPLSKQRERDLSIVESAVRRLAPLVCKGSGDRARVDDTVRRARSSASDSRPGRYLVATALRDANVEPGRWARIVDGLNRLG
jgi:hypothetical protein